MALEPRGINQRDELHLYSFFVLFYPPLKVCVADRNIGKYNLSFR